MFGTRDYAVGDSGLILHSSSQGNSWGAQVSGTTATLHDVEMSTGNNSRVYCVGDRGVILKTLDAGLTWYRQASPTSADLHGVFFYLNDMSGWAVGTNGTVLRTTDGGGPLLPSAADEPALGAVFDARPGMNPCRDAAEFLVQIARSQTRAAELFNASGRRVWSAVTAPDGATHRIPFSLAGQACGTYFYRIRSGNSSVQGKLVHVR
jgi:hypothetical protein